MRLIRPCAAVGAAAVLLFAASSTRATVLTVAPSSLPSAQGWTFGTGGSPVTTEAASWSLGSGVIILDTMAYGFTGAGTSSYYAVNGIVNLTDPLAMVVRARIVQFEGDFTNAFVGGGFAFGFAQGTTQWYMGVNTTQIRNINGTVLSSAYDNTAFHTYRLEWTPPSSIRFYVDGTLISTNSAGFSAAGVNRVYFGDVTGASNSRVEIESVTFLQGGVVATEPATWGRVKALYRN
jgi:hypothetical protein